MDEQQSLSFVSRSGPSSAKSFQCDFGVSWTNQTARHFTGIRPLRKDALSEMPVPAAAFAESATVISSPDCSCLCQSGDRKQFSEQLTSTRP
jgi:hypothetical protein